MNTRSYYIVMVRPVGSHVWTSERLSSTKDGAEELAIEERNRKITFSDGSVHLQSTAIVHAILPGPDPHNTQQHYSPTYPAMVELGIP